SLKTPTSALFIFGDSIVDAGTNNHIKSVANFKADYHPYGQNGFFNGPTGRFSDGRVLVDFIAELANIPAIPPFLQPSAKFINGANFASAGAGILSETNQGLVINLETQIKQFEELQKSLQEELGETEVKALISKAVYLISIGTNDYLHGYTFNPNMQETFSVEDYVGMVTGNLSQAIQDLYDRGARKFGVLDLMPLGCMPSLRALNPNTKNGSCFEEVSEIAKAHNRALLATLIIQQHIYKGFKYVHSNFFEWMDKRIHFPSEYGFRDAVNACCGKGAFRGINSCGRMKKEDDYEVCEDSNENLWWDSVHVSEKVHEQLALELWTATPSLPGSYNFKDLFSDFQNLRVEDVIVHEQSDLGFVSAT
ncbi:GDSL lipase/esterase protein, partial [Dioscorea alata]